MKRSLADNVPAGLVRTVPPHAIHRVIRSLLLQDDAHGVCEAHGVVRCVARKQEHVALADDDVFEVAVVDDLEHHGATMLVEPLGRGVDVVVCSGVGTAYNLREDLVFYLFFIFPFSSSYERGGKWWG